MYGVYMIFHVKSSDSFNIPLFLSVCTQRGWSDYMCPFSTIRFAGIVYVSNWNFFHEQTNQFREVLVYEYAVSTEYWSISQRQKGCISI